MATPTDVPAGGPTLKRALTLRHLVLYGIIVIQPVAPVSVFGVLDEKSKSHVVTTILIAMVAMLLTAYSYGRMAAAHPSAGSAFTYVGKEIHPAAGYLTGWSMVMDYMLNPMICILWCSKAAVDMIPGFPFAGGAIFFFLMFTAINLRGIEASARFNTLLAAGMGAVILYFFGAAILHITGNSEVISFTRPLYDPNRWDFNAVLSGTSIAVLTYIGFDGISTLSEEVENPRRNIMLATVFSCLAIGILGSLEVYAAQLIWPAGQPYPSIETAFAHAAKLAGGPALYWTIMITMTIANTGSGTGAQLGAARLLYGMGRSGALPPSIFGHIDSKRRVPSYNIVFVGLIAFVGAFVLEGTGGFDLGVQLLNFGALIAFMGVNLAAFVRYFLRERQHTVGNFVLPLAGFAICLLLWLRLSSKALALGAIWVAVGLAFGAWKTRGFRGALVNFDIPSDRS